MVSFPVRSLDLRPFTSNPAAGSAVYDLYGVVNHYGSMLGGHYTAFVRCPDPADSRKSDMGEWGKGANPEFYRWCHLSANIANFVGRLAKMRRQLRVRHERGGRGVVCGVRVVLQETGIEEGGGRGAGTDGC